MNYDDADTTDTSRNPFEGHCGDYSIEVIIAGYIGNQTQTAMNCEVAASRT